MSRSPKRIYLIAAVVVLCISCIAHATVTQEDRQFLTKTAQFNVNQIGLSRLAKLRASRQEVKAFADKMVTDHRMLETKLKPFAMAWSITLPSRLDAEHKADYRKLRRLSGPAFDRAYMDIMDTEHNAALEAFTHEANVASDPDFKSTVISEKSVLAAHTNMADDLKSKL